MPPDPKGIEKVYDLCSDGTFYEWVVSRGPETPENRILPKQFFMAPVCYKDKGGLTLKEDNYLVLNEEESTWKITTFDSGLRGSRLPHRPYKQFQLESDDDLVVLKCKIRPVLLISKLECNWKLPLLRSFNYWLCLPIFTYKRRHNQEFVIADQKFETPTRLYFPPGVPGLNEEAAGLVKELQFIPEGNLLYPHKCHNVDSDPPMDLPVKLSDIGFEAVIGHIAKTLPEIEISGQSKDRYDLFKELAAMAIDDALSK